MLAGQDVHAHLRRRLDRPTPRIALGRALGGVATACIDVSDGLLADVAHIAEASAVGIVIDVDALPASQPLRALEAAGFQPGDDVEIGGVVFELDPG